MTGIISVIKHDWLCRFTIEVSIMITYSYVIAMPMQIEQYKIIYDLQSSELIYIKKK